VIIDEERVLRQGWTEIKLWRYWGWFDVRTLYVSGPLYHISGHPAATGRTQDGERTLARDWRSTAEPSRPTMYYGTTVVYHGTSSKYHGNALVLYQDYPGIPWYTRVFVVQYHSITTVPWYLWLIPRYWKWVLWYCTVILWYTLV